MNNFQTYQQRTSFNRISKSEMIDGRNYRIEDETDFDVLNWGNSTIDVMNRLGNDEEVVTVDICNKTTSEIITILNNL